MKDYTIEQVVMAVAPPKPDKAFTSRVMGRILAADTAPSKQKPRFALFAHMPKFAVVAIAVVIALALSGTAYAVYNALWPKPTVHSQSVEQNQFGRTEVVADFKDCATQTGQAHYEIKKGASITPEDVPKLLQAACERGAIEAALPDSTGGMSAHATEMVDGSITPWSNITTAVKVTSITDKQIAYTGDVNAPAGPLNLDADTKYIVNGMPATRADISAGDTVMFQTIIQIKNSVTKTATGTSASGTPVGNPKVTYVIKVGLPYQYYNPAMQNQIVERKACAGNPADTCLNGAMVDLYSGNVINTTAQQESRKIEGVMQSHSRSGIVIKTSSGHIITINLPRDIVAEFNNSRSGNYGVTIKNGDTIAIDYIGNKNEPTTDTIQTDHVAMIGLELDLINKSDPIKPY